MTRHCSETSNNLYHIDVFDLQSVSFPVINITKNLAVRRSRNKAYVPGTKYIGPRPKAQAF